ncbi:hypothetical protein P12x_005410 [Tundrisphaera lichenicola]|uniref:hypothetical protein n=1 Tax=Tundrisphaera lichenicola TaxID=2029860 RepID=UPI003EB81FB8
MANNRRGDGQNAGGGSAQGAQNQVRNAAHQVQQGAEQLGQRIHEGYDTARESAVHQYRQAEGTVARNPGSSVLIGLGVGFGLGLVLSSMLTRREETWAEKYLPESLQDVPDRYRSLVSSLKTLPRSVHDHLPASIARHLG